MVSAAFGKLPFLAVLIFGVLTSAFCHAAKRQIPVIAEPTFNKSVLGTERKQYADPFFAPDKAQHFIVSAISVAFIYNVNRRHFKVAGRQSKTIAAGVSVSFGILKELVDMTSPRHHASWRDLAADIAGVAAGLILVNQP